ncbi:MAG: DNA-directed RNA polymerase subunit D [archaeon GW2011_AR9]|nr:MAG: DNA-directed RNA polymerase subunit D [archaeon GW2011_AR9]MBS3120952.1 DNA-directed RNA polymerase subunit D [Candidatus Woesearchaeota archaeon]HIG92714.1 DNA-directed RNA polymerase subunit D [Candidatus Woesearchaeota archaeon]HIH13591.1 DNA-directed RNA polymerase subunit D [Candidatus Woesearchaeota archaeon]
MKIEKIKEEKKKNKLSILLKDTDEVFANAIRRLILEEVPTLAVEDLEIKENNSALYDEFIGLRLGLIPLKTDLKSYNLKEKCKCERAGCAQCELKITLKSGSKKGYVYAEDAQSADPKCVFAHPKMPIVKLLSKQKIDMTMTAILGTGRNHVKWSPGWAYFKKEPVLTVGKVSNPELVAEKCSDGVFTLKNKKLEVNEEKVYDSQLLDYYSELDKGITVELTDNIIFTLESWGQLSCKEILSKSADIFIDKTEEMEKLI